MHRFTAITLVSIAFIYIFVVETKGSCRWVCNYYINNRAQEKLLKKLKRSFEPVVKEMHPILQSTLAEQASSHCFPETSVVSWVTVQVHNNFVYILQNSLSQSKLRDTE